MDPLSIGLMLAGAAVTAYGQNQALERQKKIQLASQQEQMRLRDRATDVAMRKALEFQGDDRKARQDEIAQQLEGEFRPASEGTPITAQGVQVGATIPGEAATRDYLAASAREKAKATDSLRTLAQLMGRLGSAGQLRRDEAIGLGDTAGEIGRIQGHAGNLAEIENIRTNAVTPSLGSQLIGGAMSAYGAGRLASGGIGAGAQRALRSVAPGSSYANPSLLALADTPWN